MLALECHILHTKRVAGGGAAYYFAKKSINEDRQTRYREQEDRRRRLATIEQDYSQPGPASASQSKSSTGASNDLSGQPSQEASLDPAPTRHAPESDSQRVLEKSKYEASEPYRAKKGDRFS